MCFVFLVKCKGVVFLKILNIGSVSILLMCLSEFMNLIEKSIMWGGCGIKIFLFFEDFII